MKSLVIIAHPNLEKSKINSSWFKALIKENKDVHVHNIYEHHRHGNFDVSKEQKLIEKFDKLILQFPLYWFNCTPLLKEWIDSVFTYGWAYGPNYNLENIDVSLLVTAGGAKKRYSSTNESAHTLEEILVPFKMTFTYMKANYKGFFVFYGAELSPTDEDIERSTSEMINFVRSFNLK